MGIKGDKQPQDSVISAELLLEKLESIGEISSKRMFGGHGIFCKGQMFGIIDSKGQSYLKTDESNRDDFVAKGVQKHNRMPYYAIPDDVMASQDELLKWAQKSIAILK